MINSVTIVNSEDGDWQGIYVNGILKAQSHSLSTRDILNALDVDHTIAFFNESSMEKMGNSFPQKESDIII